MDDGFIWIYHILLLVKASPVDVPKKTLGNSGDICHILLT